MEIGAKIRQLRQRLGLTQTELADRCELSKGFISLLERDKTSPSIATLVDILESLGTNLNAFFNEQPDAKIVFTEDDMSIKEDEEGLRGSIKWLVPNAQKNHMEPILIAMAPGGQSEEQGPHEGEEFGYVFQGQVTLVLGDRRIRARRGESFYFEATEPHQLINTGKTPCRVLWVASPPSF